MYSPGKKVSQKQPTSHGNSPQTSTSPAESSLCFSKELSPGASKSELSILTLQILNFWKKQNNWPTFCGNGILMKQNGFQLNPISAPVGFIWPLPLKVCPQEGHRNSKPVGDWETRWVHSIQLTEAASWQVMLCKRKPLAFHIPSKTLSNPSLHKALELASEES